MVSPRLPHLLRRPRSHAFTLIELLVVVVIIAILLAVAIPAYLSQQTKAKDAKAKQYLAYAYRDIRSGIPETNNQFPGNTSMVSWVQQSEPELTASVGNCYALGSLTTNAVVVDSGSTGGNLTLCTRSDSGNVWKLTATPTSAPSFVDATIVPLAVSGNEITDATRAANTLGDGLTNDSSTGTWESTTNLDPNGGAETNSAGALGYSNSTLTRDTSKAKFGSASFKITATAAPGFSAIFIGTNNTSRIAVTVGATYTFSFWALSGVGTSQYRAYIEWDTGLNGGYFGNTPVVTFTPSSSWQRVSVTGTVPTGAPYAILNIQNTSGAAQVGDTIYVDGVQLEQKPFATPYVETNGATAFRSAARVQAPASLLNATQGWVAIQVRREVTASSISGNLGLFATQDAPATGYRYLFLNGAGVQFQDADGGGSYDTAWQALPDNLPGLHTIVAKWTLTQLSVSADGALFSTITKIHGTPTFGTTFDIGTFDSFAQTLDGDVLWFACGTGTLSNADAATINGFGSSDPQVSSFSSTAQATMVWNGVGSNGSLK